MANLAGLPIRTSPWAGTDRQVIALIRQRLESPSREPDGPPLNASELARFRLSLAEGIDEAYAAIYEQAGPEEESIVVYGLRFSSAEQAVEGPSNTSKNRSIARVVIGPVVASSMERMARASTPSGRM